MKLRRTSEAQFELAEILHNIVEVQMNPINAGDVLSRVEQAEQRILDHPKIGKPGFRGDTFEYTMPHDPICLIYRITGDTIELLSVFHEAREPRWRPKSNEI